MMIGEMLNGIKSLAITGHVRPDGDCVGSTLALYTYVTRNYPEIYTKVYLEEPTEKLSFITNFDKIDPSYEAAKPFDLMICLDCASFERIGRSDSIFHSASKTVNIDHHVSNTSFADENYVFGDASSTCEILFDLLDKSRIDRDIAISLYTGIIYDTGVFKYPATSPKTMRIAADLMEYDIPTNYIIDESFYAKTYEENRVFGYAVLNSTLCCDGKVIYSYITREKLKEYGVSSKELEGIVAQLRLTRGVDCAFWLHELSENEYKASFRSNENMDVNKLALKFGGGGHVRASGATLHGSLEDCIRQVLDEIGKIIDK